MIREHEFNSVWWGKPVGIIEEGSFFSLGQDRQWQLLEPYEWVEFKSPIEKAPSAGAIFRAGFFCADMQMHFRIGLNDVPLPASGDALQIKSAHNKNFSLQAEDMAAFKHERFAHLPGVTQSRINERYALWSDLLISQSPQWCLQLEREGVTQGWFLARADGHVIDLTLGMLHRKATISGLLLYQAALNNYASLGGRVGLRSFSVTNSAVLNIYARLGARFAKPSACWLWVKELSKNGRVAS